MMTSGRARGWPGWCTAADPLGAYVSTLVDWWWIPVTYVLGEGDKDTGMTDKLMPQTLDRPFVIVYNGTDYLDKSAPTDTKGGKQWTPN